MRVELASGELVGTVDATYELPQGLALDVRRSAPRDGETVLLPFDERTIASVDRDARVIVVDAAGGVARVKINVVTIFPEFFAAPLALSIPARAAAAGQVEYRIVDLRDYTHDRHRTVDDYPYGGGAGMVMKPEPFFEAVDALAPTGPIVLMSARGRRFAQADAVRFAASRSSRFSAATTRTSISASPIISRPRSSRSATSC